MKVSAAPVQPESAPGPWSHNQFSIQAEFEWSGKSRLIGILGLTEPSQSVLYPCHQISSSSDTQSASDGVKGIFLLMDKFEVRLNVVANVMWLGCPFPLLLFPTVTHFQAASVSNTAQCCRDFKWEEKRK